MSDTQPFTVQVVRSTRRRRTVGAELKGDVLKVALPSWMSAAEEAQWVEKMSASFRRKLSTERIDLPAPSRQPWRSATTCRARPRSAGPTTCAPGGVRAPRTGSIRISTRLAAFPDWVIDYVIVHELCHLRARGHGPDFWALVERYPKAERAIGYLIAKAGDDDDHGVDDG